MSDPCSCGFAARVRISGVGLLPCKCCGAAKNKPCSHPRSIKEEEMFLYQTLKAISVTGPDDPPPPRDVMLLVQKLLKRLQARKAN